MLQTWANDITGQQLQAFYDRVPDECPVCHRGIAPIRAPAFVSARAIGHWTGKLEMIYRCPREDCNRAFIAIYRQAIQNDGTRTYFFLEDLVPSTLEAPEIEEAVATTSPNFINIYRQALAAEHLQLNEVCGCGFRRAIEFLIKDYLIARRSNDADSIKKAALGVCINNYITDANVKACAERATWLGNDQTHYERQYTDHDISHLKELIRLTMYWIASETLTAKYRRDIPQKSR